MPPIAGAPDVRLDYRACAAVREAIGPDVPLMLDPNHWYSGADALWLGRRLEELGFLWLEEAMEGIAELLSVAQREPLTEHPRPREHDRQALDRAEWIAKGACDMVRTGAWDVGGIGPALKRAHVAESFGMSCEVHGTGAGNLAVCAAIANTTYYERGLLHPFIDYDRPPPYLSGSTTRWTAMATSICAQSPGSARTSTSRTSTLIWSEPATGRNLFQQLMQRAVRRSGAPPPLWRDPTP
jgi:L-alanine-DL-glutamate epimerase-like enolase superfamily enzyme